MEDSELSAIIGKNIVRLRKLAGMTQLELAEKLNYSDKSVSKWEQGNGIPDVRNLMRIAEVFNVTLDDLVKENKSDPVMPKKVKRLRRLIITLCAVGLCWLVAVVMFVILGLTAFNSAVTLKERWLVFVYAVPASAIIVLVFSTIWRWGIVRIVSLSVLIWTAITALYLTLYFFDVKGIWYLFLIGVPLQVLALFFFLWLKRIRTK